MCQLWQLKDWHLYLSLYSVLQEKSAINLKRKILFDLKRKATLMFHSILLLFSNLKSQEELMLQFLRQISLFPLWLFSQDGIILHHFKGVCFLCSWIRTEIIISNSFSPVWRPCTHCWAVKVESVSNTRGIFAKRNCFLHKTKVLPALVMRTLLGKKILSHFVGSSITK